jgi:hypothetical protein
MDPQILKIIGIQDYLWEQVTALATPYWCALQCANGQNNIYGSAFMPLFVFILILPHALRRKGTKS